MLGQLASGQITIQEFHRDTLNSVEKSKHELEKHRGWKQVLGNLALAIMGLGVLYLVAAIINKAATRNFLFFKTDSADKVGKLKDSVDLIHPRQT